MGWLEVYSLIILENNIILVKHCHSLLFREYNVVVQFSPWFKFSFRLFQTHYHTFPYPKKKKIKFKPRTKLNHNIIYTLCLYLFSFISFKNCEQEAPKNNNFVYELLTCMQL